jgi:type VI secretion system secreted protein VgrG
MADFTEPKVEVKGFDKAVVYKNLRLEQGAITHHYFSFVWNIGDFKADGNHQMEVADKYIGKLVTITLKDNIFVGLITKISIDEVNNASHSFIISGQSPSVLLSDNLRASSYYKKNLSHIVDKTFTNVPGSDLKKSISPLTKDELFYIVQYNETDFDFLVRLAKRWGEWFFYDGQKLVFGEPDGTTTELTASDLHQFRLNVSIKPLKFSYTGFDPHKGEALSDTLDDVSGSGNYYLQLAGKASNDIFGRQDKRTFHANHLHNKQLLDKAKAIEKDGSVASTVFFEGRSKNPGVKCCGKVKAGGDEYRVISVIHYSNQSGHYENSFIAVPASVKKPPYTNIHLYPHSDAQSAIVKENNDADGLGRIKVQFPWQSGGDMSPWLRIASPHTGGGKGMHFIPEKGEEVIVAFEGGDAEKPYVIGTVYNGKAKITFANAENDMKVIQTRSGHVIELNDTSGGESITIKDKNSNSITIDTVENSISIKALDTITLAAMTINLIAGATVNVQAAAAYNLNTMNCMSNVSKSTVLRTKDLTHTVADIFSSSATTINQTAKKDINSKAKEKIVISSKDKLDQRAGEMDVSTSNGKLRLKSSSDLEIKGTTVKTN